MQIDSRASDAMRLAIYRLNSTSFAPILQSPFGSGCNVAFYGNGLILFELISLDSRSSPMEARGGSDVYSIDIHGPE